MYTAVRLLPRRAGIVASSFPAAPTNGSPWRSSLKPGASPTIITSAGHGPTPGTACVRGAWSPQFLHARIVSWSWFSSGDKLSDFDSSFRFEADELAGIVDGLHHRLQLLVGESYQREAERARGESHRIEHRLDRHRVGLRRHERLDHGQQPVVDVPRDIVVALQISLDHLRHRTTRDVGHDADDPIATHCKDRERPAVVAAPHPEVVWLPRAHKTDLVEVAARFLDAHDAGELGAAQRRGRGHLDRGPALDVVR